MHATITLFLCNSNVNPSESMGQYYVSFSQSLCLSASLSFHPSICLSVSFYTSILNNYIMVMYLCCGNVITLPNMITLT